MPAIRQSLRHRCNVQLRIYTSIPPEIDDEPEHTNDNICRGRSGRRARNISKHWSRGDRDASPARPNVDDIEQKKQAMVHTRETQCDLGLEGLYELIPYLALAYSDGSFEVAAATAFQCPEHETSSFTHFIRVVHATSETDVGEIRTRYDDKTGGQALTLPVPRIRQPQRSASGRRRRCARDYTVLTDEQLLAARDFLCLALPYYSQGHPSSFARKSKTADAVHVLITAPPGDGAAADIMSIAACYLSFASDEKASTVVKYIDDERDCIGQEWRDVIGQEQGIDIVERVVDWDWKQSGKVPKLLREYP